MNSPHADRGGQDGGWRNLLYVLNLIPVPRDNLDIKGRGSLMPFNVGLSIPTHPPRLEAQFYKKLMLIDRFFILIELLLNNFNKIKLLGDRNFLRVNQKLSPKKSQPKEKDLHQISSFR